MLIEALQSLKVRFPEGDLYLEPGKPVELSEDRAQRLLEKVPGKVRVERHPEIRPGNQVRTDHEGPFTVCWVDIDTKGRQWVLVRDARNNPRWLNTKFVRVERGT